MLNPLIGPLFGALFANKRLTPSATSLKARNALRWATESPPLLAQKMLHKHIEARSKRLRKAHCSLIPEGVNLNDCRPVWRSVATRSREQKPVDEYQS